ncbi:hypothetical protein BCR42DRAFT_404742 [Absidia repens]|uniref:EF-hand domain-containing protein n=1 Tax=Absidia repens TaxID=90262 RepID=A0A1X2IWJ2_9FUNG|nr:hypothetical protein BCR42DRAFT_404742 [Absidia repens]
MSTDINDHFSLLLDDSDNFLPRVEEILKEIYTHFDEDKDNFWNTKELQAFAEATNGRQFDQSSLDEIIDSFDVNKENQLTFRGFYEMYHIQTLSDPEETLNDFKKHGYDDKLELVTSRTQDEIPKDPPVNED